VVGSRLNFLLFVLSSAAAPPSLSRSTAGKVLSGLPTAMRQPTALRTAHATEAQKLFAISLAAKNQDVYNGRA
jgi:hypothetical protein